MGRVSSFIDEMELLITPGSYDVYIFDMDDEASIVLGPRMKKIDSGSRSIYLSTCTTKAYTAAKIRADYFIKAPVEREEFFSILTEIKDNIKADNIVIKIPSGERRIRINHLNYVNIVKRCLCYHLTDGSMFDGQTLRTSFEKAINPLQNHPSFFFLSPSTLINLGCIKILNNDNIIFDNDKVLYFPKKAYTSIRKAWINYNKII